MKKTNKENPITFFRKANEARQTSVKKSIKKAQDGIETNDDLINKSGYGAKKSTFFEKANLKKYIPWEGGPVELINPAKEYANPSMNQTNQITPEMANRMYEGPGSVRNIQGKSMRQIADTLQKVEKQKKGGINLSKKSLPKKGLGDSGVSNTSNTNVNYKSATFASSKKNPFTGRTRETVIEQTGPDQYTKKQNIINRKGEYIGSKSKPSNANQYSKYSNIGGGNTSLNNPITQSNKGFDFSSVANPERKKGGTIKKKMQDGGSSQQGVYRSYGAEQNRTRSGSTYGNSPQAKTGGSVKRKKK